MLDCRQQFKGGLVFRLRTMASLERQAALTQSSRAAWGAGCTGESAASCRRSAPWAQRRIGRDGFDQHCKTHGDSHLKGPPTLTVATGEVLCLYNKYLCIAISAVHVCTHLCKILKQCCTTYTVYTCLEP